MAHEVQVIDRTLGQAWLDSGSEQRVRAILTLSQATISTRDLIRFRVEDTFERRLPDPLLLNRTSASAETALNAANTTTRSFSGVPEFANQSDRADAIARAVETALQGFVHNRYLIFVNETQIISLDEEVALRELNEVCFVQLVPLQGG